MTLFMGRGAKGATSAVAAAELRERSELLDEACGIGLWEAVLHNADAMSPRSRWTWSPEFRRLLGYDSEAAFPNVVQSWSDRLHPDDVAPTFAAFGGHLTDRTGKVRYDVTYRLKTHDGTYRWFRATGGCRHSANGSQIRACGSLSDIHAQKMSELTATEATAQDRAATDALARGLAALAQGDLTYRITDPMPLKSVKLKDDFNTSMDVLEAALQSVNGATSGLRSGSEEISRATDDLSRRTEQQAASLEETAAALGQITATGRSTASGASHARQVVAAAREAAERSGQVVADAVVAMDSIAASSAKVGEIIGVIDGIAFQTNLLALNAGVEAARAGDAGRGFAVVASEVRALAQRSAQAAKEIKTLVSLSTSQVAEGVDRVGQTGQTLTLTIAQFAEINTIVAEIASSAAEQAGGLAEVNTAIEQMDRVTQQNAAMVEQATAASHALVEDAEQLSDQLRRFKVGAVSGAASARLTMARPPSPPPNVSRIRATSAPGGRQRVA